MKKILIMLAAFTPVLGESLQAGNYSKTKPCDVTASDTASYTFTWEVCRIVTPWGCLWSTTESMEKTASCTPITKTITVGNGDWIQKPGTACADANIVAPAGSGLENMHQPCGSEAPEKGPVPE